MQPAELELPTADTLPDWSAVGYRGGQTPPQDFAATVTVAPGEGPDTQRVQQAIDTVSAMPPNSEGHRGVVEFGAGEYQIDQTLRISASGVVLRGAGQGEGGTVLFATQRKKHTLLQVGGSGERQPDASATTPIRAVRVPMGSRVIPVEEPQLFEVGQSVVVQPTPNDAWVRKLGMDRLREREDRARDWKPTDYALQYERVVTAVGDDSIAIDVPLPVAIEVEDGGGKVWGFDFPGRVSEIGIENLQLVSAFDEKVKARAFANGEQVPADERHAWVAIQIDAVENAWICNVTAKHFAGLSFRTGPHARSLSILNCKAIDPVAPIKGGRRYGFSVEGELTLVKDSYCRNQRHDFAMNQRSPGPNAFVNCIGEQSWNLSEPHHRWAVGVLFDNVKVNGPMAGLATGNRGTSGTGHGWAGANVMFWNCRAPIALLMQPPGAHTWLVGQAEEDAALADPQAERFLDFFESVSPLPRLAPVGDWIYTDGRAVVLDANHPAKPSSLYQTQVDAAGGDDVASELLDKIHARLFGAPDPGGDR
jgi:hypothetical protein